VFVEKTNRKLLQQILTKVNKYLIKNKVNLNVTSHGAMFQQPLRRTLQPLIRYWAKGNGCKKN